MFLYEFMKFLEQIFDSSYLEKIDIFTLMLWLNIDLSHWTLSIENYYV